VGNGLDELGTALLESTSNAASITEGKRDLMVVLPLDNCTESDAEERQPAVTRL
jgi:hypothetical protein